MNIRVLSGVYDDSYRFTREDGPQVCTSAGKRKVLYKALAEATRAPCLILSPHPRGKGKPYALGEQDASFDGTRQIFSKSCSIRKLRYLLDLCSYARLVFRNSDEQSIFVVDNYELTYIAAIYYCYLRGRTNPVILEYEDGKHAIHTGWVRLISLAAELFGKPLVKAAILATPQLAKRLEPGIPSIVVPGIIHEGRMPNPPPNPEEPVRFLYSGSLDYERGLPLLLEYLQKSSLPPSTVFEITGQGHFTEQLSALMERHPSQVIFHGTVSDEALEEIRRRSHYGLNLQSSCNPISDVTYPSKTFDYLNAGIRVVSTDAAGVREVLNDAAIYLPDESVEGLGKAIREACDLIRDPHHLRSDTAGDEYTFAGTVARIKRMLIAARIAI